VQEPDLCEACGKTTLSVHGRCPNCWQIKRPDLILPVRHPRISLTEALWDLLGDLAWLFPGAAVTALALFVVGDDAVLIVGLVLLLSGGAIKFRDSLP
jgi:hypothetical protein